MMHLRLPDALLDPREPYVISHNYCILRTSDAYRATRDASRLSL
jgi:hypothetical protein